MAKPIVFMFSGQGSHFYGMAAELYRSHSVFRDTLDMLSRHAEPSLGSETLIRLIYEPKDPQTAFSRTLYTHPALYAIQCSMAKMLIAEGIEPDACLGYSLGEYVALAVSGAISMETGMDLVLAQAEALEREAPPAAMLAVLGNSAMVESEPELFGETWLASVNNDKHFVLSGQRDRLELLRELLVARGITALVLAVSHGFHSPLVEPAHERFLEYASGIEVRMPSCPVYSAMRQNLVGLADAHYFWQVCRNPVYFRETVLRLEQESKPFYIDLGPSGTLANFTKAVTGEAARCAATMNQWGRDLRAVEQLKGKLAAA